MEERWIPSARSIYQHYVANTTVTFQIREATDNDMRSLLFFTSTRHGSFAMINGEQLVGYGILAPFKSREAFDGTAELTLYLTPSACGKGLGSRLLSFLEAKAVENGFHALIALVCGENLSSRRLFEKSGYFQCACFREAGLKFGRYLDLVCYERIISGVMASASAEKSSVGELL